MVVLASKGFAVLRSEAHSSPARVSAAMGDDLRRYSKVRYLCSGLGVPPVVVVSSRPVPAVSFVPLLRSTGFPTMCYNVVGIVPPLRPQLVVVVDCPRRRA